MHIITGLNTGGAEMMLYKLLASSEFQRSRHVVISLRDKGTLGSRIEALNVPLHTLGLTQLWQAPVAVWRLFRLVRHYRPKVIQGWMYHGNLFASFAGVVAGRSAKVFWNIRHSIATLSVEPKLTAWVIRIGALLSRKPHSILYNSFTSSKLHEEFGYDKSKTKVIPNGFETEVFKPDLECGEKLRRELKLRRDGCVIGLIARFHPMKDHEGFLRAAAQVLVEHPRTQFVLAGTDVDQRNSLLRALIVELKLDSSVHLLGERKDTPCVNASLDIAVNSSWRGEAFSNAIGEAMACGVPCVVTDVGDSAAIVADTGVCVPPKDPTALAQALKELINAGETERKKLGASARQRIVNLYSMQKISEQYSELYEID